MHYSADLTQTEVMEVDGRPIEERDGKVVYCDTQEEILFN